jgi:uncharacterized membrane protein
MRNTFIMIFILNLILAAVAWIASPSHVAIHFGAGGEANGWAPAFINALLMAGMNVMIFLTFYFLPHMLRRMSPDWINLPNKEYWLLEENRGRMESMFTVSMYQFGTATLLFLFLVSLLSFNANLSHPVRLSDGLFWIAFTLYMLYTAYWTVTILRAFHFPK